MAVDDRPQFQPPPWQLRGEAVVALKMVRKELVQSLVPPDAHIVSVGPGRTIAVLYLAQYRESPVGEYREIIVAPAIVRWQGRLGAWISHILVDSERSVLAGRCIWALPKELASMQWHWGPRTEVRVDAPELKFQAKVPSPRRFIRLPFAGAALTGRDGMASTFVVHGTARVGVTRATIDLSADVGLDKVDFDGARRMFVCADMSITIGPPKT
jgi:hypothetical protein